MRSGHGSRPASKREQAGDAEQGERMEHVIAQAGVDPAEPFGAQRPAQRMRADGAQCHRDESVQGREADPQAHVVTLSVGRG